MGSYQCLAFWFRIKVDRIVISTFVLNGVLAALGGIVYTGRVLTATATSGNGYELDAIAAVVIGGTCVSGGEGSQLRTIIGVLFVGIISNALNLLGINPYIQYVVKGVIILAAVGFDNVSRQRAKRK